MICRFVPKPLCKEVVLPPSKSLSHRYLIAAALAPGESFIENLSDCGDLSATLSCLQKCGVKIEKTQYGVSIRGIGGLLVPENSVLDCRESGSTLRFLLPLLLCGGEAVTLTGAKSLLDRPLSVYEEICRRQGLFFSRIDDTSLKIGGKLTADRFVFRGDVSSQFATGLLFALPLLSSESRIELLPPVESRPYFEMTCAVLAECGIEIDRISPTVFAIRGNQTYRPIRKKIEGDASAAANYHALNALPNNSVTLVGTPESGLQGDAVFPAYLEQIKESFCTLSVADCPDLAPILSVSAALFHGCTLTGTRRLKYKESDRAQAIETELSKCGVTVEKTENSLTVRPIRLHTPSVPLDAHGDHRIAMAMAVLLSAVGGELEGAEAVAKSAPDFFALWEQNVPNFVKSLDGNGK